MSYFSCCCNQTLRREEASTDKALEERLLPAHGLRGQFTGQGRPGDGGRLLVVLAVAAGLGSCCSHLDSSRSRKGSVSAPLAFSFHHFYSL